MKQKVLIIGIAGLIGGAVAEVFRKNRNFQVVGADKVTSKQIQFLDITKKNEVSRFIKKIKPAIIILTAAFTNVDACQTQKRLARDVNFKGAENVARAAKGNSSKLIYLSTSYIFDGKKGNYRENDKPHPINYYAQTKLEAEKIIQKELKDYLIIRTNWVFDLGYDARNFIVRLLDNLKNGVPIKVPVDQYGNPTLARNIAWGIEELITKNKKGIYHMVGRDKMNRYEFAKKVAKFFNLNPKLIIPVSTSSLRQKAKRPKKDDLNIDKARKELKTKLLSLQEALVVLKK